MWLRLLAGLRSLAQLLADTPPDTPDKPILPTLSSLVCLGDCRVVYDGALVASILIVTPNEKAFLYLEENHLDDICDAILADCPDAWVVMVSPEGLKLNFLLEGEVSAQ